MAKEKKIVRANVDGIHLNASYFGVMDKDVAVKKMAADGILKTHGKDEDWADNAHDACIKALEDDKAKEQQIEEARRNKIESQN